MDIGEVWTSNPSVPGGVIELNDPPADLTLGLTDLGIQLAVGGEFWDVPVSQITLTAYGVRLAIGGEYVDLPIKEAFQPAPA